MYAWDDYQFRIVCHLAGRTVPFCSFKRTQLTLLLHKAAGAPFGTACRASNQRQMVSKRTPLTRVLMRFEVAEMSHLTRKNKWRTNR